MNAINYSRMPGAGDCSPSLAAERAELAREAAWEAFEAWEDTRTDGQQVDDFVTFLDARGLFQQFREWQFETRFKAVRS
ncbi:hypothetical protein [Lysobacter sp. GCM10012299]|uniref:hypothetical protein n=1 Tax=Lysobacter sp. GCM10012299 TaxID=3317333 RepID=UPI003623F64A